ncbi:MAG: methyltransferase [Lachnospiraceae bacterium]|nr:methyltransferase [Lachnospiraceae bacterium]
MKETIGNVTLDYTFYPGEDLYSDGAVEDELLSIAREYDASELNQVIAERKSWPILYHFSHVRQNIVGSLPISKKDRVLEIGSGCGAITGALSEKAASVTCVELSRKRSHINAWRNRNCGNVEILVGNFQDIEKTIGTYDVITLIGVFEYSNGYIGGEQPFVDMLKIIRTHLAPGGRLVIAIENRLGLKYWAGCTEDHTGTWFEGIEDYPETRGVHTFSYKELDQVVQSAGGLKYQMYYPYPDYKFPLQIFSDERLPQPGELKELRYNFDRARMVLFDEIKVADSLICNDLFPVYSNSFLMILTQEETELPKEHCIYTKYSNERAEQFSTRTEIWSMGEGRMEVRKLPASEKSANFVNRLYPNYLALQSQYQSAGVQVNRCQEREEGVALEFCQGRTLEEELDQLLAENRIQELRSLLGSVAAMLKGAAAIPFRMTEEFREVFGEAEFDRELLCPALCNIDPVASNLIRREDGWDMLDYEWSFDFPVPAEYQIFRLLHYYLYTSTKRDSLQKLDLFAEAGISPEELAVFQQMEQHFQAFIQTGRVPMRDMYDAISPGVCFDASALAAIQRKQNTRKIQIYVDQGQDFSEDNSWHLNTENGRFSGSISLPEGTVRLRIDPCEENCIVEVEEYLLSNGQEDFPVPMVCKGRRICADTYYFSDNDPYFLIDVPKGMTQMKLSVKISYLGTEGTHPIGKLEEENGRLQNQLARAAEESAMAVDRLQRTSLQSAGLERENQALKNELKQLREKIQQMENTRVWKAYTRIRGNK